MRDLSEAEMLHRMAAYCSTAERCVQDVEKKIKASGLSADAAHRIIEMLRKEKFLDESRFSRSFVNDKLQFNKWGRIKIGYELKRKNIPETYISEAIDAIEEDKYTSILIILLKEKKKTIRGKDKHEIFYKLMRFAAGRGFEGNITTKCLKQLDINDTDYEETME